MDNQIAEGKPITFSTYLSGTHLLYGYIDHIVEEKLALQENTQLLIFSTSHPGASYLLRRCLNNWKF